ncbi:beta-glucanase [Acrasis kona]|uniref:Beta-glucanase n=1 Tax=Acrasis kona TaxID=1008807 RepID=A0AAW2Z9V8_9EUKA
MSNGTLNVVARNYTNPASRTTSNGRFYCNITNIMYGSFRAGFSVGSVPGAVASIFFYANDTQEIDVEILTRQPQNMIYYSNQPSTTNAISFKEGNWTTMQEHGFDWFPGVTSFYRQGVNVINYTKNVPVIGGRLTINMWSNGNPNFSGGPPNQDAVMKVSWVKMFFNTTTKASPCVPQSADSICVPTD